MSITVVIESTTNPAKLDDFMLFLEQNLPNVRGFEGCLSVSIFHHSETNDFLIYEEWKSETHHKTYIDMITQTGVLQELTSFLDQPPAIKYFVRQLI